ncbi:helix-turn-helix domain-containing protein [Nocardia sp. CA-145437]|uniref:helix-turn-helix domain-containing protein n=1 Tax=Nocardia sp. CA-145437 TaxID=3239980 RepID=UPI003D992800
MDHGRVNRAIGHALRIRRKQSGLTMSQIWDSLGWGVNTYKRTEQGTREISVAEVLEVAELLGIDSEEMLVDIARRLKTGDYPQPSPGRQLRRQLGM